MTAQLRVLTAVMNGFQAHNRSISVQNERQINQHVDVLELEEPLEGIPAVSPDADSNYVYY